MAITATIVNGEGINRVSTGTYIQSSTAAAYDVNCGFTPKYVKVFNETSGDQIEWNENMADAEGFKRITAGTGSLVTSNGITPIAANDGTEMGFTIGLDTDINVSNEQVSWLAIG